MNKKEFTTPVMEITSWEVSDVIATSVAQLDSVPNLVSAGTLGTSSTKTVVYSETFTSN